MRRFIRTLFDALMLSGAVLVIGAIFVTLWIFIATVLYFILSFILPVYWASMFCLMPALVLTVILANVFAIEYL